MLPIFDEKEREKTHYDLNAHVVPEHLNSTISNIYGAYVSHILCENIMTGLWYNNNDLSCEVYLILIFSFILLMPQWFERNRLRKTIYIMNIKIPAISYIFIISQQICENLKFESTFGRFFWMKLASHMKYAYVGFYAYDRLIGFLSMSLCIWSRRFFGTSIQNQLFNFGNYLLKSHWLV